MKRLIFSISAIALFTLSSFTVNKENKSGEDDKNVPCRWRTVTYYPSGNVYYGAWNYGECEVWVDGSLHPILN